MNWLEELSSFALDFRLEFVYSLIIILVITILRWVMNKLINAKANDVAIRYKWRKITTYLYFIVALILITPMWLKGFESIITVIGLSTAGVAIALRDLLSSFVGWLFILVKKPFSIGDRIEVDGTAGDVIDIRIFQFSLIEIGKWVDAEQSTGRVLHIPNNQILYNTVANYTADFPFIWNEIPVLITFESDWEQAKKILLEITENKTGDIYVKAQERKHLASKKFLIYYSNLSPIVYTKVEESGILLTIRYLCEPQQRRNTEGHIWEGILEEFAKQDSIKFAYPTHRYIVNKEGYYTE